MRLVGTFDTQLRILYDHLHTKMPASYKRVLHKKMNETRLYACNEVISCIKDTIVNPVVLVHHL